MNSKLVECKVLHHRFIPRIHKFWFKFFWFCIDLRELESIRIPFILERNRFGIFSFWDIDHLYGEKLSIEENIKKTLLKNGETREIKSIRLYTSLRVLGYVFNPVSYYMIELSDGNQVAIIEICNTFKEIKPFFVASKNFTSKDQFTIHTDKNFYISPFTPISSKMLFKVNLAPNKININIDVFEKDQKTLLTYLEGSEVPLNKIYLFFFKYPLITLQVIFAIHWQALILFLKKVRYYKKTDDQHLQKGMVVWRQIQKL